MNEKVSFWATLRQCARHAVIVVSATIVGLVALIAVSLWFVQLLNDPQQTASSAGGSPFTLAQVMAIFGAFGIAGGFSTYGSPDLRSNLRLVGVFYILSTLGFSLLGMMLPILLSPNEGISSHKNLEWVTLGAFAVAAVTFCWGTFGCCSVLANCCPGTMRITNIATPSQLAVIPALSRNPSPAVAARRLNGSPTSQLDSRCGSSNTFRKNVPKPPLPT